MYKKTSKKGYYGNYGGMFVSELLIPALQEVAAAFESAKEDKKFANEVSELLRTYGGRPTPLYFAHRLSEHFGYKIYLKREDLMHGGAHKTNNTIGQGLLAKRMGKKELIAETGAGQHGVAVAMIGALLSMPVKIFMGAKDIARQAPNVQRMKIFGATVIPVTGGKQTLKEAINDALRYYVAHAESSYYLFGTAAGPHPFPQIVRHFQEVIGREAIKQIMEEHGSLPDAVLACVGGGSNAIGIFSAFLNKKSVRLFGVEAAGKGINTPYHGASLTKGSRACLHGAISYALQNNDGQIQEAHSISAGLDYPGVGPEHAHLKEQNRVTYLSATDTEAVSAFHLLCRLEGIIPALESAHALAAIQQLKKHGVKKNAAVIVNLSGRGDKDLNTVAASAFKQHLIT